MPSAPYQLVDGKAKIQIEDVLGTKPGGGWVYQAPGVGNPGAEGAHYYYKQPDPEGSHKTAPEEGRFAITLDIENAGIYGLLLRVSRDTSDPPDARNDIWIQIDGDTTAVMPEGTPPADPGRRRLREVQEQPAGRDVEHAKVFSTPTHGDANAALGRGARQGPPYRGLRPALDRLPHRFAAGGHHAACCPGRDRSTVSSAIATGRTTSRPCSGASSDDLDLGRVNGNASPVGVRFTGFDIDGRRRDRERLLRLHRQRRDTALGSLAIQLQGTLGGAGLRRRLGTSTRAPISPRPWPGTTSAPGRLDKPTARPTSRPDRGAGRRRRPRGRGRPGLPPHRDRQRSAIPSTAPAAPELVINYFEPA